MKFLKPALKPAILFALLVLIFPLSTLHTQQNNAAPTSTLILRVAGVRNKTGVVRCALFTTPQGWPEDKTKSARFGSLPANGGVETFTISGLPEGTYAISVIHDENENHKLDRDLFGRPKEGIGFGNNPKIRFSAPTWKQSSVHVAGASIESTVDLRYP